jgi:hypothetical protein
MKSVYKVVASTGCLRSAGRIQNNRVRFQVLTTASLKIVSWVVARRVVWLRFSDVSDVLAAAGHRPDVGGSKHV